MNEKTIQEQYQHIIALLKQQRLKEAQSQLESFLWNSGDWALRNRLEQAQTSYQYMLQYMRQGIDDPERQKLYRQILTETWEVADQARLSLLDGVSTHYYHSLRNNRERLPKEYNIAALQKVLESFPDDLAVCQLMPDNQGMDAVLQRHEQTAQVLFLSTWSNSDWSAEDEQQAKGLLESEMLPTNDLCLFTSAVMLSLMECFDTRKFSWLLDAVTHANTQVNQRALVGIAFALLFHPTRLSLYPELTARLSLLNEDSSFGKQLNRIYIELLRSQETEKIDKKMREEIIPEMMRNVNIMRNMKFGFEENPEENDLNPDWEKAFESSGLGDKIREMNELQLEGLEEQEQGERSAEELFELLSKGDALAQAELSQKYLRAAAEMAVEMNCEEIFIADLIQEANISLLMALGEEEPEEKDEKWLLGRIRCGIRHAIEEQTQRKFEDDYLVAKVEKLEAAVRELTEDEEDESSKFSVEELAIILDMDEEEIRDVLRLTGDDK